MSLSYTFQRPYRGLFFALAALSITLLIRWLAGPQFIENFYSRGFFQGFRTLWGLLTGWIPIPLFWLFWFFVLTQVQLLIKAAIRDHTDWFKTVLTIGRKLVIFTSWLIVAFLWMWGYNYARQSVLATLKFEPYSPTLEELRERVYDEAAELATLRASISTDTLALSANHYPTDWEKAIRPLLVKALKKEDYPVNGRVRGRILWPPGLLLRWSTAGVYWPWVGEGHIDGGLLHLQKPSVLAHELAHAYGFGDEGTCSFWAYLAGEQTDSPALRYAFRLDYWRRLASRLRRADPDGYTAFRKTRLDRGIINDLKAIYANNDKYPDLLPAVRDATYNTYLKAQGIEEGMLNYGKVLQLVEGWRRR